jgi:hypothetical protein
MLLLLLNIIINKYGTNTPTNLELKKKKTTNLPYQLKLL